MKCGICNEEVLGEKRREHLRFHKLDDRFIHWLIENDDYVMLLSEKYQANNSILYSKSK
jgi:hypothetical protein